MCTSVKDNSAKKWLYHHFFFLGGDGNDVTSLVRKQWRSHPIYLLRE